jgi:hypothetical protein
MSENRPHVLTLHITPEEYRRRLLVALGEFLPLMQECWGTAPGFTVTAESRLVVTVDFGLKGFPHNGRRFAVNAGNFDHQTPEHVARLVVEEVYDHAATCPGCGHGMAPIRERLAQGILVPPDALEAILFAKLAKRLEERIERLAGAGAKPAEAKPAEAESMSTREHVHLLNPPTPTD